MSEPAKDAPRAHVLVVEDSSVFREMQGLLLRQAGYAVSSHESPGTALEAARGQAFDLVVIDYELPEMNGEQFMHALRGIQPEISVVFVSGSLTLELAIKLSSQGVAGIFNKPANPKTLLEKINETLSRHAVRDTAARTGSNHPLSRAAADPLLASREPAADEVAYPPRYLLGQSDAFREFSHRIWKVRDFRAVLLLQGEPGSPFELVARDLAEISLFREGPTMVCDVDTFEPRSLIEVLAPSLLSHDAGTLIVTGVERFTAAQQKTLEYLITGRDVFLPFARRFRLVLAATHALSDRVDDGSFGENLFYKISSLSLTVPPLRDMRGDIPANAEQVLIAQQSGAQAPVLLSPDAAAWLEAQDWPGNYDQLAQLVVAALDYADAGLTVEALEAACAEAEDGNVPAFASAPPPEDRAAAPSFAAPALAAPVVAVPPHAAPPHAALAPVQPAPAPPAPAVVLAPTAAVARPAASLSFAAKPKAPAPAAPPPPTARSLFRPASDTYRYEERLQASLAAAEACLSG